MARVTGAVPSSFGQKILIELTNSNQRSAERKAGRSYYSGYFNDSWTRRRISQAPREVERDLEDAVYLACAVDGEAHLLTTEDSDLRLLGENISGRAYCELERTQS